MIPSFLRGIRDVSKFASRATREVQTVKNRTVVLDPTYRYHIPRRLQTRQITSVSPDHIKHGLHQAAGSKPEKAPENPLAAFLDHPIEVAGEGSKDDHTPISLYLSSIQELDKASRNRTTLPKSILQQIPRRAFHSTARVREDVKEDALKDRVKSEKERNAAPAEQPSQDKSHQEHFYDRLHLPQFHRPTKEELLAAATGFWSRLRVRFKWATIKSVRPYTMDELLGFFSWIFLGHLLWIILGTTTFVSLAILAINTVFAQETLAGWVGNYLTKSSGVKVVFESAIVPKWSGGVITFKNVFVSRRPGGGTKSSVTKGSPEAAAIEAAQEEILEENQNYTQFDVNIGEVNVTLSFSKWWNSKGLLKDVSINHIRGIIDRTHVHWDTSIPVDPKSFRHEHVPGDFEIESFTMSDLLLTIHQPKGFRPFTVSIFDASLPRLRKQWLFYDFLCANHVSGEFDRSLFTVHQRQTHSYTGVDLQPADAQSSYSYKESDPWKRQSRVRVDALNIDHLNHNYSGPFSWITEGNVDIVADLLIPSDVDESALKLMSDFYDRMEAALTSKKMVALPQVPDPGDESYDASTAPTPSAQVSEAVSKDSEKRFLVMDMRIHLNEVRASVPIFTRDLSYINNALIRPIVAYINSRKTFIPLNCRVVKLAGDFDGSWTIFDSGLMDDMSAEVYDAFARDVTDEQARSRRIKKVGLWGVQLAAQAIFLVLSLAPI